MSNVTVDAAIAAYLKLRAAKSALLKKAEVEAEGLDAKMLKIETWLRDQADKQGVTSFKTASGTAFLTKVDYASVADWDQVLAFIKENGAYDMLEHRVAKNAVKGYIEANKAVPPGVNYGSRIEMNFRKPSNKLED